METGAIAILAIMEKCKLLLIVGVAFANARVVRDVSDVMTTTDDGDTSNLSMQVCVPGAEYYDNCNPCYCNEDGSEELCTMNDCDNFQTCDPGTMFMIDCNQCYCQQNGTAFCTQEICSGGTNPPNLANNLNFNYQTMACNPGTSRKVNCNTCFCNDDGTNEMCTQMNCPQPNCEPGTTFMVDCNQCDCQTDGTPICTAELCSSSSNNQDVTIQPNSVCTPGIKRRVACNLCYCNQDGTKELCTQKNCPLSPECEPGTTFMEDCNSCFCEVDSTKICEANNCDVSNN